MSSAPADALAERLFSAAVASFDLAGVYLGYHLPIENDFFRFYQLRP